MRVLIVVSDKPLAGGVEGYYRKLAGHLKLDADYLPVGRNRDDLHPAIGALRLGGKVLEFAYRLVRGGHPVVLVNPSLETRSLARDLLFLLLAKGAGRRCIVFFRGWQPELEARIGQRHKKLIRRVLNLADAHVVLAEQFRRTLRDWGVVRPIHVESTTVDWPEEADAVLEARRRRGPGPLRLLFVARLIKSKGLPEAIETVRVLHQRGRDVQLMVAGDGPELEPARESVRARGIWGIEFLGYLRDAEKHAAFAAADVFFLPTRHGEGMANAVLEAMAHGLPVVTRAVGGVVDFFDNQRMGALTTSADPEQLADQIERFADPGVRLEAGRFNMDFARRYFTAPTVARRLDRLVREVAESAGQRDGRIWLDSAPAEPLTGVHDR